MGDVTGALSAIEAGIHGRGIGADRVPLAVDKPLEDQRVRRVLWGGSDRLMLKPNEPPGMEIGVLGYPDRAHNEPSQRGLELTVIIFLAVGLSQQRSYFRLSHPFGSVRFAYQTPRIKNLI